MADRLDVAGRLAEGRPAIEHTQSYVQACQVLGYHHPDLTSHPSQVRDWYDSEDGLDLRALDHDCAELRAAEAAVAEALHSQRARAGELAAAWTGPGGDCAAGLLQRHCDAASAVVTELRAAAQRYESLRDNLWHLVDAKVATAIAVDDRTQAQRQAWLAAAAAITTGTGDRPPAEAVVRHQVMPYVDNDIRHDWLTAMRSTLDGVATSYDMVIDRMAAAPPVCFEFPGDLGPDHEPAQQVSRTAPISPAAGTPPAAAPGLPVAPAPAAGTAAPPPDWGTALGAVSGLPAGELGGGPSGLGGLAGLARRIVDAMGDLIGSAAGDLGGGADPFDHGAVDEDSFDERPFHPDEEHDATDTQSDEPDQTDEVDDTEQAELREDARPDGGPPPDGRASQLDAAAPAATAVPAPEPQPVAAAPPGAPVPAVKEGSTPCETAADELPQAGQ